MNCGAAVVIASTSKAILEIINNRLVEIGLQDKVIGAQTDEELQSNLCTCRPRYLLIEGSFYREATPQEMLRLINKYMSLRIYVFSYHEYPEHFIKCFFRAGVEGYLDLRKGKTSFRDDLKCALAGKMIIPRQFEGMSFDCAPFNSGNLTCRDMQIVHLISEGLENREIAEVLHLKLQSVKNRRKLIYDKLQVTNTIGLLKRIIRRGIIDVQEFLAE